MSQLRPDLPAFLYGHSMGGFTNLSFLMNNPSLKLQGVIFSAPFLAIPEDAIDD